MFNDFALLKTAYIDLNSNDVVKNAGAVQTIKNWISRMLSPEYRERAENLSERSEIIRSYLTDLITATEGVQKAVSNADVNAYEESLEEVRILVGYLNKQLEQMEDAAELASVKPEVEKRDDEPSVVQDYKQRHRPGYNVPIGDNLDISVQDLDHLNGVTPVVTDNAKRVSLVRFIIPELKRVGYPVEVFGDSNKVNILFEALLTSISGGTVISNEYSSDSRNPPPNPVEGQTRITIRTPEVTVPDLSLSLKAELVFSDKWAQADGPKKELSLFRVQRVWDVKYSGKTPSIIPDTSQRGTGKKVMFLVVPEYLSNDESKKDIVDKKEQLKKKHNVDEVLDVPADKVDMMSKYYAEEGYEIAGAEVYQPKVSTSARRKFLERLARAKPWWEELLEGGGTTAPEPEQKPAPSQQGSIHKWARNILNKAFKDVMGREPTLAEVQIAQAVALAESGYGRGWKGPGKGSNNWGAIQCVDCANKGKPIAEGVCPPGSFYQKDSIPTSTGKNKIFHWCYKSYPTPEAGAADLIKTIFKSGLKAKKGEYNRGEGVLAATNNGSITDFSTAMYDTGYYGGFGKTREERIAGHISYMNSKLDAITSALGEKPAFVDAVPPKQFNKALAMQQIRDRGGVQLSTNKTTTTPQGEDSDVKDLEKMLWASMNESPLNVAVKNAIAKKHLPTSHALIITNGASEEYIQTVCGMLHRVLGAEIVLKTSETRTEINCKVAGSEETVTRAVQAVCDCVSDGFEIVNKQIVKSAVYPFVPIRK